MCSIIECGKSGGHASPVRWDNGRFMRSEEQFNSDGTRALTCCNDDIRSTYAVMIHDNYHIGPCQVIIFDLHRLRFACVLAQPFVIVKTIRNTRGLWLAVRVFDTLLD